MARERKDTRLQSEGAEFLVLGNLLIEGISAYKAYHNFKGYDLIAVNAENNTSARIQVKSRFKTGWEGFIINNFDCDFVVLVSLNRGFDKPKKNGETGIMAPTCYVFPVEYIKIAAEDRSGWGKISKSKLKDYQDFQDKWDLIQEFLSLK
ncbi:hypothetical protein [Flavobacterium beibuense]|uniref:hypothetical protein n=1 Tax=Flavobacterium beibuense TaxID=657326 RepID=UPI00101C7A32|nr:hypothetical protein [Flavobacterium beibuense]